MLQSRRPSKIQAALLQNLKLAARISGYTQQVHREVVADIAGHFFRASHVRGAVKELERLGWLYDLPNSPFQCVAPNPIPDASELPGDPAPLLDRRVIEDLLRRRGFAVTSPT